MRLKLGKSGEFIRIEHKAFAGGGEGNLFHVAEPLRYKHRLIAKIYHPHKLSTERQKKLEYLLQHPPIGIDLQAVNPSIVWVQDLLYDDKGQIRGFLMPFVKGEKLEILCTLRLLRSIDSSWNRFALGKEKSREYRLRLCFNIAVAIHQVHASGEYVLVDLKPDNIVVQAHGIISLVDMDSVEVVSNGQILFDAPVATPEYTPPEHYQKLDYDPTSRQAWDRFSLAVILYKLLFGIHPFAGGNAPPYEDCLSLEQKI